MSMIQIIAHREEEDIPLGFDFRRVLPEGASVTGLHSIRIERRSSQGYEDVTREVLEVPDGGGLPHHEVQGTMIVVAKRGVAEGDDDQPPGHYLVHIAATTDASARPMVLDIDGRVPVLVITDGR